MEDKADRIAGRILFTIAYILGLVMGTAMHSWSQVLWGSVLFALFTAFFIWRDLR